MRKVLMSGALLIGLLAIIAVAPVSAADLTTIPYGSFTLNAPSETTHWNEIWDLTQGDLTLSYTIDMSGVTQPPRPAACSETPYDPPPAGGTIFAGKPESCDGWYYEGHTQFTEVGLRGEGAGDFNPGPFGVYQGKCGGWMVSDSNVWLGNPNDYNWDGVSGFDPAQDLDDLHGLQASGGRGAGDYDVLASNPDSVLTPFGSGNNYGMWFDRDGVDKWQALSWGNLGPGGVGSGDGLRYNTGGIYDIVITYHAIDANGNGDKTDDGLGVMFATVNGYPQGFYTVWVNGQPQLYPAGMSFKGDMEHMQVFAGIWSPTDGFTENSIVELNNIEVTGYPGTSDPLVADFTYSPAMIFEGDNVQFTDASHGGMPPYTYSWKFGDDETSTLQNPTHAYSVAGSYEVQLKVTPFRCVPKTVTKTLTVLCPTYLNVIKFYDADADGAKDIGEVELTGWPINIGSDLFFTPVDDLKLPPGTYTVSESPSGVWMSTTLTSVEVILACHDAETVEFGNLCLGEGYPYGGMTPGYWSNKNGEKTMKDGGTLEPELGILRDDLNLRNKDGSHFNPTSYNQFKTWLLKAEATNMAYKLSSSLAAMALNVEAGFVDGTALVYAPGVDAANELGFISIADLITAANNALLADPFTPAGDPNRAIQEAMYKALDNANNNYNFVQQEPCAFAGPD